MAFTDKSGISVTTGFKLQSQLPLDIRTIVDEYADLDDLVTSNAAYEGLSVYVTGEKKFYYYNGSGWNENTGSVGTDGASAYEIAVENGFTGTESEWLESLKGEKGDTGDTGSQGEQGEKGDTGDKGDTGEAGASAYEIAVTNGYEGTESEWLESLKGDKGDTGDTGETGAQGEQGAKGDDGIAATVEIGTVTTGDADSEASVTNSGTTSAAVLDFTIPKGAKGDTGEKGDTGAQGENGQDGYTPVKGEDYFTDEEVSNIEDAASKINTPLFPDLDTISPIKTIEYDIAATSYYTLFTRPAITGYDDATLPLRDKAVFRITITGGEAGTETEIYAQYDVCVMFTPKLGTYPRIFIWRGGSISSTNAYSGLRYMRVLYPKDIGDAYADYPYALEISTYNATSRHIVVEVFESSEYLTWNEALTATGYNSTYQSNTSLTIINNNPPMSLGTWNISAASATYLTSYLQKNTGATLVKAGEAISSSSLIFRGTDLKYYMVTNTEKAVDVANGIQVCGTSVSSDGTMTSIYPRQKCTATLASSALPTLQGTKAVGQHAWLRFHRGDDGNVYSDNVLFSGQSSELESGYIWYLVGQWNSATSDSMGVDTVNSHFIELDTDKNLVGYDGVHNVPHYGNAVFFGDSMSTGSSNNDYSFVDILSESGYYDSVTKIALGSTTFGPYSIEGVDDYCFVEQVKKSEYEDVIKNADYIYFEYGYNDLIALFCNYITIGTQYDEAGTKSICGYLKEALDYILSLNPAVHLVFLSVLDKSRSYDMVETISGIKSYLGEYFSLTELTIVSTLNSMLEEIGGICSSYSVVQISLSDIWSINAGNADEFRASDGAHANTAGHERIAKGIVWQTQITNKSATLLSGICVYPIALSSDADVNKITYQILKNAWSSGKYVVVYETSSNAYMPVVAVNEYYMVIACMYIDDDSGNIGIMTMYLVNDGTITTTMPTLINTASVSVEQIVTSGTPIATINGVTIYAPT